MPLCLYFRCTAYTYNCDALRCAPVRCIGGRPTGISPKAHAALPIASLRYSAAPILALPYITVYCGAVHRAGGRPTGLSPKTQTACLYRRRTTLRSLAVHPTPMPCAGGRPTGINPEDSCRFAYTYANTPCPAAPCGATHCNAMHCTLVVDPPA